MQYAIIQTGGKQYQVVLGQTLLIELLEPQEVVTFSEVLLYVDGDKVTIGHPFIEGVTVTAKVDSIVAGDKLDILRYKSKSRYRKHTGHRQKYHQVTIQSIGDLKLEPVTPKVAAKKAAPAAKAEKAPKVTKPRVSKPKTKQ